MARAGLGSPWKCVFANDFDVKKAAVYEVNWGLGGEMKPGDIRDVQAEKLPDADLAWASFPCQDLSLAGGGAGLKGERSGTFYPFWDLMKALIKEGRGPKAIALENVQGTITSHKGKDFRAICKAFANQDYRFGALVVNASLFVPQSRPRFFMVAFRSDVDVPTELLADAPVPPFHTASLGKAVIQLRGKSKENWMWWRLPCPPERKTIFADVIEDAPEGVTWHTKEETASLIRMMSPVNLEKLTEAKRAGGSVVGGVYKRTRVENGVKVQRAEVRFDDLSGCLRTPAGGSSRQTILVVEGEDVRSRLISPRETARLMGLPDSYQLPRRYNDAYHLTGDGVVVPVVRHIANHIIEPTLKRASKPNSQNKNAA